MHDPRLVHPFCGPRAMASNDPVRITSHIQLTARYLSVLKRPYPGARKISNPLSRVALSSPMRLPPLIVYPANGGYPRGSNVGTSELSHEFLARPPA